MALLDFWQTSDAVNRSVALLLLGMSIGSWMVILRQSWRLRGIERYLIRSIAAFWQSQNTSDAIQKLSDAQMALDPQKIVLPLVVAFHDVIENQKNKPHFADQSSASSSESSSQFSQLADSGTLSQQLTRNLRNALHESLGRLQKGQVLLATVGSIAPFVGLLGTVWSIFHALTALAGIRSLTLDQVAAPVGEALVMTAAGLAVAIPAVLAYNLIGRILSRVEADLEGLALDLRELALSPNEKNLKN